MPGPELQLLRDSTVVRVVAVEDEPVSLGRDLGNSVTLLDDDVSSHHAVVAQAAGGLEVRDLRSTNGTFVNGQRVDGKALLADGDELRLGASARFRICLTACTDRPTLILEHRTAGTAHLLDDERYRIGADASCNLVLPGGPAIAATLVAHANGEVWIGTEHGEQSIEAGVDFEVHDQVFRLVPAPSATSSTVWGCREAKYGYQLRVGSDATLGVSARLLDPSTGNEHEVKSENRTALLFALGKRLKADLDAGVTPSEAGWTHDEDLLIAVWGRAGFRNAASTYSVLIHRLRKEVEEAGFDPWFIEKKRGAVRLRLQRVVVDGGV